MKKVNGDKPLIIRDMNENGGNADEKSWRKVWQYKIKSVPLHSLNRNEGV